MQSPFRVHSSPMFAVGPHMLSSAHCAFWQQPLEQSAFPEHTAVQMPPMQAASPVAAPSHISDFVHLPFNGMSSQALASAHLFPMQQSVAQSSWLSQR